jgi:WD40 repeat protein
VALVDASNGYKVRILCDLPEQVLGIAVSQDSTRIVAGCGDKTVRFFDLPSGVQTRVLRPHADWVQSVAFNRSGSLVVSTSRDRTARTINSATGEIETIYRAHESPLLYAAFSADSSRIYSTARGGSGHVWMPDAAAKRGDFKDFAGDAEKLAVSPLGVAAGCADGAVRLYQPGDSAPYFTFSGHHAPVQSVAASRDGEWLASGSADGEVILWSPACASEVRRFRAQP